MVSRLASFLYAFGNPTRNERKVLPHYVRERVAPLASPLDRFAHDRAMDIDKLVLESKSDLAQRGEADDADALALNFAQHVAPLEPPKQEPVLCDIFVGGGFSGLGGGDWMR